LEITFDFPHVFEPEASQVENALVLNKLLEMMIAVNLDYLRYHSVPPLYRSGVRYAKTRVWLPIPALYRDGLGDCKSLTAALVAEYRSQRLYANPVFRFIENKNKGPGVLDFHILVQTSTGFEDPSKVLGMPHSEVMKFG
jgi:hypothetical protein